ncbi:metal-dependent hydrolase [Haloglomus halophilum]|uniref:metal-dependent hydrolase n=1 Tax=Haloglomus halophilum TaxID=2962672 RepID=UPI0020C9545E|nr:metal-dependent hydrolase [Haloglomus halophilum]
MPSTVVHVAFGLLVAAAVLGPYFDRRALLAVAAAVVFVDLDTVTSLVLESTHRALFHTVLLPLFAATYLYAETRLGERSLVRERYGDRGVRVAWAAIAAVVVSGIGLDLTNPAGVNILYPLHDQFYAFDGAANYSTRAGFQQSFVEVGTATPEPSGGGGGGGARVDVGGQGSTRDYHVGSGIDPDKGREPKDVRRVFPVVFRGWQLLLVVASVVGLTIRARLSPEVAMAETTPVPAETDGDAEPAVRRVDDASDDTDPDSTDSPGDEGDVA